MLGEPNKGVPMRTFLGVTVACAFLTQGCAARNAEPVSAVQSASASVERSTINCREIQGPFGPVLELECPEFDLIVSLGPPVPLSTLSDSFSKAGLAITETVLMVGGSQRAALRLGKLRSDGRTQIGWATIVIVNGAERNATCYLRPPHTEEEICTEGLSQFISGQLSLRVN